MGEDLDLTFTKLSRVAAPPLPAALRQRALATARTNLAPLAKGSRSLLFAQYAPPLFLVPSLLISAGAAFLVDVFIKVVQLFWTS